VSRFLRKDRNPQTHPEMAAVTASGTKIHEIGEDVRASYDIKEQIGKGMFSVVYRGVSKVNKQDVAIKVLNKKHVKKLDKKSEARLETEITILKAVSHANVACLKEMFENKEELYLVMEYAAGGELFKKVVKKGALQEREAAICAFRLVSALDYLHSLGIVHRDLKPENLLLKLKEDDSSVMITDFGLSRILDDQSMATTACGTPYYVAPEVINGGGAYGMEVDFWSLGVITYFLLCGFPPFMADDLNGIFQLIQRAEYDYPSPYWDNVSENAKDFIRRLLVTDPRKRMLAGDALKHPWIVTAKQEAAKQPVRK